jgi:hypothetical protein
MTKPTFFTIRKEPFSTHYTVFIHTLYKKGNFSSTLAGYGCTVYIRQTVPSAVRRIFLLPPTALFLHEIGRDPFHQQGGDFSRQIGWGWGKIPTWWENSFRGNGKRAEKNPTRSEEFRHGRKKDGEGYMKVRLATEFRSEKILRNRIGTASVILRKKVLIPRIKEESIPKLGTQMA